MLRSVRGRLYDDRGDLRQEFPTTAGFCRSTIREPGTHDSTLYGPPDTNTRRPWMLVAVLPSNCGTPRVRG